MDEQAKRERFERIKVDIDTRLSDVWRLLWDTELHAELDDDDRALIASLMRAAYGVGYRDAYQECEAGRPGELAVANGYTKGA
jgi:hypothetical protein